MLSICIVRIVLSIKWSRGILQCIMSNIIMHCTCTDGILQKNGAEEKARIESESVLAVLALWRISSTTAVTGLCAHNYDYVPSE